MVGFASFNAEALVLLARRIAQIHAKSADSAFEFGPE
jgi:hypothetical protein